MSSKTQPGNFFEDFRVGQEIVHATPRTVTDGDVALYTALYRRPRSPCTRRRRSRTALRLRCARRSTPMLVFHIVFGKTVPDISLNAIANLGYADGRFGVPVYPGDTLSHRSRRVIGLQQNKRRHAPAWSMCARSARNQRGEMVVDYCALGDGAQARCGDRRRPEPVVPDLPDAVAVGRAATCRYSVDAGALRHATRRQPAPVGRLRGGRAHRPRRRHHHRGGRPHDGGAPLPEHGAGALQPARRARRAASAAASCTAATSSAWRGRCRSTAWPTSSGIAAIHGGRHTNPSFAGDTIYAWSEILARRCAAGPQPTSAPCACAPWPPRTARRADFPYQDAAGAYDPAVVLDFDYTVLMPRR